MGIQTVCEIVLRLGHRLVELAEPRGDLRSKEVLPLLQLVKLFMLGLACGFCLLQQGFEQRLLRLRLSCLRGEPSLLVFYGGRERSMFYQ